MTADIALDTLEAKGLIKLATLRPELEYLFRHALVQDAAYGSLLKQERRELHLHVGEALEQLYPDRLDELAPVLAMHFVQAGEHARAIDYFVAAGRHAIESNAIQEAYVAYDQAANLIEQAAAAGEPPSPAERRRRIEVLVGRAQAGYSFLSAEMIFDTLEAAVPEAKAVGDLMLEYRVHLLLALGRLQAGELPTAPGVEPSLDRIAEIADAVGDPTMRAVPLALVGLSQVFGGPVREGVAKLEEAVPLLAESRDSIGASFARGGLAIGYASLGEFAKADAAVKNAREIAERGDLIAQLDALIAESMVRSTEGQLDKAVPIAQECVDRAEATGASACVLASSWVLGDAFHRQGRFTEARDVLRRGADVALAVDRRIWRPTLQAWLRTSAEAVGGTPEGDFEEALAMARSVGNEVGEAGILAKRGEHEAGRGDFDASLADLATAGAILERLGLRPSLARLLRGRGEVLRAAGRADEARPVLGRSLALFEELGLEVEANAVRAAVAVGGTKLAFD